MFLFTRYNSQLYLINGNFAFVSALSQGLIARFDIFFRGRVVLIAMLISLELFDYLLPT